MKRVFEGQRSIEPSCGNMVPWSLCLDDRCGEALILVKTYLVGFTSSQGVALSTSSLEEGSSLLGVTCEVANESNPRLVIISTTPSVSTFGQDDSPGADILFRVLKWVVEREDRE